MEQEKNSTPEAQQAAVPLPQQIKSPIKWRAVLAESAFIGASIIFAFALQDWDEEKDIEERTLIALCNVKSELSFNRVLIKNEYIPRQRGMLALTNASITQLRTQPNAKPPQTDLKKMLIQESLRYSAWALAGESGYLLHANFQLATEIGALFDYQQDRYQITVQRVIDAVSEHNTAYHSAPLDHYANISGLVGEWSAQTTYLEQKYEALFAREDFLALPCES